jgi:hypothetical protein
MFELTTLEAALSASMMVLPRLKRLLPSVRALIHSQIQSVLPQDPQLPPPPPRNGFFLHDLGSLGKCVLLSLAALVS